MTRLDGMHSEIIPLTIKAISKLEHGEKFFYSRFIPQKNTSFAIRNFCIEYNSSASSINLQKSDHNENLKGPALYELVTGRGPIELLKDGISIYFPISRNLTLVLEPTQDR